MNGGVARKDALHTLEGQLLNQIWSLSFPGESHWMKQFESFELDTSNECLWHEGVQIVLASKPFSVLRYLVENSGRLITHDELMDALWPTTYVQPQVLRTYMLELRKVLGDDAKHPKFIQTVPKRGYSFIASVKENADPTNGKPPGRSGRDVSPTELVGRDGELVYLLRLAQLAASAQRQLVFIAGEAGIGKTSLLNAFREALDVELSQACMAWGHCVEGLSEKEDYYPVFEAIGQCIDLAHQEGGLAAQFAWRRTLQNKPGKLCEALEEIARAKVFIIVIEDIQWADQCTVDLISALARRGTPAKLLVIATYRPHDRATNLLSEVDEARSRGPASMQRDCARAIIEAIHERIGKPAAGSWGSADGTRYLHLPALRGQSAFCAGAAGAHDRGAIVGAERWEE